MILQLTSLLDLLLLIVFVQYLEMQRVSARAISAETQRRQDVESQRDRLLKGGQHNLYEVWQLHLNGNKSVYPDGSILITSATQKKVFSARDADDFAGQIVEAMKFSPKPASPCILLLTWGNVRREALETAREELRSACDDPRLRGVWGEPGVKFQWVEGGYLPE